MLKLEEPVPKQVGEFIKARVVLKNSTVELEGSPEAVSQAVRSLDASALAGPKRSLKRVLSALAKEGFFSTPRVLAEIREQLFKQQVSYSPASLFPVLYKEFLKPGVIAQEGKRGSYKYYLRRKVNKP